MTISIKEFRLTFLWTETTVQHFANQPGPGHPGNFLSHDSLFEKAFPTLKSADSNPLALSHPWPHPGGQKFWIRYLNGKPLEQLSGKKALRSLVPLRCRVKANLSGEWMTPGTFVNCECFVFPHGTVIALTFNHAHSNDLTSLVDLAFQIRQAPFDVVWEDHPGQKANINVLAERAMDTMRTKLFGDQIGGSRRSTSPFTIFSVSNAKGVDPIQAFPPEELVQRALDAVTGWRPTYEVDPLAELSDVRIDSQKGPGSHILYGRDRGRAIWFPAMFEKPNIRTVSCYHRNLVFAAVQTESLGQLIVETADRLEGQNNPHPYHLRLARWASGLLGRMYAGVSSTYRSNSIKTHIHDNFAESLTKVRDVFGMDPATF